MRGGAARLRPSVLKLQMAPTASVMLSRAADKISAIIIGYSGYPETTDHPRARDLPWMLHGLSQCWKGAAAWYAVPPPIHAHGLAYLRHGCAVGGSVYRGRIGLGMSQGTPTSRMRW